MHIIFVKLNQLLPDETSRTPPLVRFAIVSLERSVYQLTETVLDS
jgi:hypothetical protein